MGESCQPNDEQLAAENRTLQQRVAALEERVAFLEKLLQDLRVQLIAIVTRDLESL